MSEIKSLSPHYKTIQWISPLTGLTATSYLLKIFVWDGLKTSAPIAPLFSVTKNNVTDSIGNDEVNINKIISDFITFNPETTNGVTQLLSGNNQAWVKIEVFYTTTDVNELTVPQNLSVDIMSKGYTYGLDGKNGIYPLNKILIPVNEYKVYKDAGRFVVPIELDTKASTLSAVADTFNIFFQDTLMDVMANDDLGWQPTNIKVVSLGAIHPSTSGSLSVENNLIKYTVGTILETPLSAIYTIVDSIGTTKTNLITINITALPSTLTAVDDFYIVNDTDVVNLTVQDNDVDGTPPTTITAVVQTGITSGTITIDGTNEFLIFTPNGVVPSGVETFTYDLTDTIGTDTGTVSLRVTSKSGGGGDSSVNMQIIGSVDGTTSCTQALGVIRYHNGLGATPTLADIIYTDVGLTAVFVGADKYYKIPDGRSVKVNNSGVVTDLFICGAGSA